MHSQEESKQVNPIIANLEKSGVNVRATRLHSPAEVGVKIIVIDRAKSMVVELKNDSSESFNEAVGAAIYSTSRPKVMSYVTIFESLWDRVDLYESVKAANEKLLIQEDLQRQFVDIAAHELKTPVQPIVGMADILDYRFEDKLKTGSGIRDASLDNITIEITKEEVDIIVRNARQLARLTSDILDVARLESGSFKINRSMFDLGNIIPDQVKLALASPEVVRRNIKIKFDSQNNILIDGDKERISQVIQNLISNAMKFTMNGNIRITATTNEDDRQVVVSVVDEGMGIDLEIIPRLFTKFTTKSEKGTGLGLYISKRIVEAHGGTIIGHNNSDEPGATFKFTLPLAQHDL